MREAGVLDAEIGLIIGHSESSMTAKYGKLKQGAIERRVRLVMQFVMRAWIFLI